MRRAPWMELEFVGGTIKVYVRRKMDALGYFYPSINVIEVAQGTASTMELTLFHELLHAALRPYSGDVRKVLLGGNKRKREELVVGAIEPMLFDLLKRNGLIRFPKPPKLKKKRKK